MITKREETGSLRGSLIDPSGDTKSLTKEQLDYIYRYLGFVPVGIKKGVAKRASGRSPWWLRLWLSARYLAISLLLKP